MPPQNKDAKRFQQAADRIARNPKLADVMEELERDPQVRNQAKGNPKGFLKNRGIDIPDEMDVTFIEGSWSIKICGWGYCLTIEAQ